MTLTIKDIKAPVLMVSAMNYNKQIRYQYHHILTGDKYEALMTPVSKARHIRGFERMHLATLMDTALYGTLYFRSEAVPNKSSSNRTDHIFI